MEKEVSALPISEEEKKKLSDAVYEAGEKARHESGFVSSQAQRLFYEYWNQGGYKKPIHEGLAIFKKGMEMAEEIRKVVSDDLHRRILKYDEQLRAEHSGIVLPSSKIWETWRPPGM